MLRPLILRTSCCLESPTCWPACIGPQCDDEPMTAQTGPDVVVIRAGVIGLSTAVCLAERGRHVEVHTEPEPSQTTSAVASAMIGPAIAPPDSEVGRWEQASVAQFNSLAEERGTGVMMPRGWRRQAGGLSCARSSRCWTSRLRYRLRPNETWLDENLDGYGGKLSLTATSPKGRTATRRHDGLARRAAVAGPSARLKQRARRPKIVPVPG